MSNSELLRGLLSLIRREAVGQEELSSLLSSKINERDQSGDTILMTAAWYAEDGVVDLLLKNGADVHAKNPKGMSALGCVMDSPLIYSKDKGCEACAMLLIEAGSDICDGVFGDREKFLYVARMNGWLGVVSACESRYLSKASKSSHPRGDSDDLGVGL